MKLRNSHLFGVLAGAALLSGNPARAIQVDEILYQAADGATPDPTALSGVVSMTYSGGILTINLKNTSGYVGIDGAGNLLTGIGFTLPSGMVITAGGVVVGIGSTAYEKQGEILGGAGFDISGEWGYRNNTAPGQPLNAQTISGDITTQVAAMGSAFTDVAFSSTPVRKPAELAGPEFGLLSGSVDRSAAGGQYSIQDSVIIQLALAGAYEGNLVDFIDDNTVVLAFSSPDSSRASNIPPPNNVPDSGATAGLLGLGVAATGMLRRKRRP
jgi:hypothetical protein